MLLMMRSQPVEGLEFSSAHKTLQLWIVGVPSGKNSPRQPARPTGLQGMQ